MKPIDLVITIAKALENWDGSPEQAAEKLGKAVEAVRAYGAHAPKTMARPAEPAREEPKP